MCRKQKPDPFLTPYTKINSRWIKELNIRPGTIKMSTKCRQNHSGHRSRQRLHDQNTKSIGNKSQNRQMGLIKLYSFCMAKETVIRVDQQPTEWEKIFAVYPSDKGLISRICKELKEIFKKNKSILKWAKDMNRHLQKKTFMQPTNKHEKMLIITGH